MDGWEQAVLDAERQKDEFVCWVRNIPNKEGFLCIQYRDGAKLKPHFPDFIVVHRVDGKFEFSLLEPHSTSNVDSLSKLKGMAEYSERCTAVSRNEMIRIVKATPADKFQSLNAASSQVRNDIIHLNNSEELDNLFLKYNK